MSAINKKINSQIKKPHLKMIPIKDYLCFVFWERADLALWKSGRQSSWKLCLFTRQDRRKKISPRQSISETEILGRRSHGVGGGSVVMWYPCASITGRRKSKETVANENWTGNKQETRLTGSGSDADGCRLGGLAGISRRWYPGTGLDWTEATTTTVSSTVISGFSGCRWQYFLCTISASCNMFVNKTNTDFSRQPRHYWGWVLRCVIVKDQG